jgi:hypothetical protein
MDVNVTVALLTTVLGSYGPIKRKSGSPVFAYLLVLLWRQYEDTMLHYLRIQTVSAADLLTSGRWMANLSARTDFSPLFKSRNTDLLTVVIKTE